MNYQADNPHQAEDERQPIFLLPKSVAILAMSLLVIHATYEWALGPDGRDLLVMWFGFIPERFGHIGLPGGIWGMIWTPFTYALLQDRKSVV